MQLNMKNIGLTIVTALILTSCNSIHDKSETREFNPKLVEKPLVEANRQAMLEEDSQIDRFVERYGWQMEKTGTGLRYAIYKEGNGPMAEEGKIAVLRYSVRLISGDEIYNSDKDGLKEFLIGRGGVESGLEEGILLLRVGDKAKFIIPSHLGFGLLGDQNLVPPKSTLIYDLELISLH